MKDKKQPLSLAEALAKDDALVETSTVEQAITSLCKELVFLDAIYEKKHQKIFTILKGLGSKNIKLLVQYCGGDPSFYKTKTELILAIMRGMSVERLPTSKNFK